MTTAILVGLLICSVAVGVFSLLRTRNLEGILSEIEEDYDKLMDRYADCTLREHTYKSELAKLKRKPRKDKGQPRKVYGGKPITNQRKVQKGEQGTNNSKSAK
jgi:hypothetical protein